MLDVDLVVTVNSNCQTYISLSTYEVLLMADFGTFKVN